MGLEQRIVFEYKGFAVQQQWATTSDPAQWTVRHAGGGVGVGVGHHFLELVKADVTVAIGIHGLDHSRTILDRASLAQAIQDVVQLGGGDQAVLVLIVELERVPELLEPIVVASSIAQGGASLAEIGELLEIDEAVFVGIDLLHHSANLLRGRVRSERLHHIGELRRGDFPVAVGIETVEHSLHFLDVLEIHRRFGGRLGVRVCRHYALNFVRPERNGWFQEGE
ncbi:hypothetical protein F0562_025306 [Nyssa sinensis]|uniref:Uncharacterized protein n=1 Tax=Nyssa sinensis TaxID=561372 RepID=A0A5J5BE07_9ASTE|nr:hypothetical protein F0562_025306 [Nyssa sinensis]